jgi:hypothetical protein
MAFSVTSATKIAGAATISPSDGNTKPTAPAAAASGIAIATSGATTAFASTVVSETVPKAGSRNGTVASCAVTAAAMSTVTRPRRPDPISEGTTIASASEAATES